MRRIGCAATRRLKWHGNHSAYIDASKKLLCPWFTSVAWCNAGLTSLPCLIVVIHSLVYFHVKYSAIAVCGSGQVFDKALQECPDFYTFSAYADQLYPFFPFSICNTTTMEDEKKRFSSLSFILCPFIRISDARVHWPHWSNCLSIGLVFVSCHPLG